MLPLPPTSDGAFMEPRGCNWWQPDANRAASETTEHAQTVAVGCDQLPRRAHGKERVCHRLPPVAEVPLSVKEGSTFVLKRQVLRTRRPTGLDRMTLTASDPVVNHGWP